MILNYSNWKKLHEQATYGANPTADLLINPITTASVINEPMKVSTALAQLINSEEKQNTKQTQLDFNIYWFLPNSNVAQVWNSSYSVNHTDPFVSLDLNSRMPEGYTLQAVSNSFVPQNVTASLTEVYLMLVSNLTQFTKSLAPEKYAELLDSINPQLKSTMISALRSGTNIWKAYSQENGSKEQSYATLKSWADQQNG